MMTLPDIKAIRQKIFNYFKISADLLPQAEAEAEIRKGVSFGGINIIILIVAIFIASLGLNVNSTAVIIGAMLISPLMGPIIGLGLAVGIQDFELMKRSFRNLFVSAAFSVAASTIYFIISPVNEGHSELLARTSPTIYDVFIGFFGGAAGILAIGSRIKGNVIPGVAIATALMPPLCTAGYGLGTWQLSYFIGALYLFFINSVFIAFATTIGVKLMNYTIKDASNPSKACQMRNAVYATAVITMLPATYLTYTMLQENAFRTNCDRFVNNAMVFPATQVISHKATMKKGEKLLTVTLMGQILPSDSLILALTDQMPKYHIAGTRLNIIQGDNRNSQYDAGRLTSTMLRDMYQMTQATISRQQFTIDSLRVINDTYRRNDSLGAMISPEIKILFPNVKDIAIIRGVASQVDTQRLDSINIALVQYSSHMDNSSTLKFKEYLEARLNLKNIDIVENDSRLYFSQ